MGPLALLALALLGLAAAVALYGFNLRARWQHRHLPGPRPKWVLGNASRAPGDPHQLGAAGKSFVALQRWARQYGDCFVMFMGRQPLVVLSGGWGVGRGRPRGARGACGCGRRHPPASGHWGRAPSIGERAQFAWPAGCTAVRCAAVSCVMHRSPPPAALNGPQPLPPPPVADPELIREAGMRGFRTFHDRPAGRIRAGPPPDMQLQDRGIVVARCGREGPHAGKQMR